MILSSRDVCYSYGRSVPIVRDLNEDFHPGEVVGITGPSGRGKSTLLYLLGLMLRPDSGSVTHDGVDVSALPDRERARLRAETYGFVFQDAVLDPTRSVLDNVLETTLYRQESKAHRLRSAVGLLRRFDVKVDYRRRPGEISGGQAQRVALCRALVHRPKIILADEPTGNLDAASASAVLGGLEEAAGAGASVIVVTHSFEVAERCDRIVEL